jgi:hypothetical protein
MTTSSFSGRSSTSSFMRRSSTGASAACTTHQHTAHRQGSVGCRSYQARLLQAVHKVCSVTEFALSLLLWRRPYLQCAYLLQCGCVAAVLLPELIRVTIQVMVQEAHQAL